MNQRIFNLSKWCRVMEGQAMPFPSPRRQRNVVLEVNCWEPVSLFILQKREDVRLNPERRIDDLAQRPGRRFLPELATNDLADMVASEVDAAADEEFTFLCHCRGGRDTIDFNVDGPFRLVPVDGSVHVYSQDSQQIEMHVLEPEVFTRIANRRQRNPEYEMMMYLERQNIERRFADLAADAERRIVAAEQGAKHRYAKERIRLSRDGKPLPDLYAARKRASESGTEREVRDAGEDRREGVESEGVAEERDVSPPTKQSRSKAKSPA